MNDRRKRFCEEYVKDFNRVRAYRNAGFKAKSDKAARQAAYKLLTNVDVLDYIETLKSKISNEAQVDAVYIRTKLKEVAESALSVLDHRGATDALKTLGKDQLNPNTRGMFNEKIQHSNQSGDGPVKVIVETVQYKEG